MSVLPTYLRPPVLVTQRQPQKVLFVGHRGSGKSTELNKLAVEAKEHFHTIGFNALDVIRPLVDAL